MTAYYNFYLAAEILGAVRDMYKATQEPHLDLARGQRRLAADGIVVLSKLLEIAASFNESLPFSTRCVIWIAGGGATALKSYCTQNQLDQKAVLDMLGTALSVNGDFFAKYLAQSDLETCYVSHAALLMQNLGSLISYRSFGTYFLPRQ